MEERLIEFVKLNPFLYDKRRKSYKNIDVKQKKWKEIAAILSIPVDRAKQRWVTLRDRYNREKKNVFQASGSGASSPKRQWKFMEYMRFLDDIPTANISTSGNYVADENANYLNCTPQQHSTPNSSNTLNTFTGMGRQNSQECYWPDTDDPDDSFLPPPPPSLTPPPPPPLCSLQPDAPQSSRRSRQPNMIEELQKAQKEMSEVLQLAKTSFQTSSSMQLFFASLATSIDEAKLSPQAISRIKVKVLSLVEEEIANSAFP